MADARAALASVKDPPEKRWRPPNPVTWIPFKDDWFLYENRVQGVKILTRLLDDLEKYIHDENCPACGAKHTSKKALIQKINLQKQARPPHIESINKRRTELLNKIPNELKSLDTQTNKLSEKKLELEDIEKKLQSLRKSANIFEATIIGANFNT